MTSDVVTMPRYLELLWERDTKVRRGPKPGVGIRDIGAAGVAIADRSGLDAVSMKAVGAALGMTTMSLYRYVDSKDELWMVMLDEAYGPVELHWAPGDGWRARADRWARALAASLVRHPWVVSVPMRQAPVTPHVLSWTEAGVRAFDGTALPAQEKMSSLLVLDGFVRNHVRQSLQLGAIASDGTASPDDGVYEATIEAVVDETRYPALLAAAREMRDGDGSGFYDDELDFGLGVLLDGLTARVDARRSR
ncbi:TetR/AcrR family transcriptional regulator [Williamsia sp.]|uniref:TetR/AcrR family transcriptional regulator n=1 Tax=Williamsia sp. TaxID=1872085 RepID=UPI001A2A3802|nr:TetR/AcrR family transcriptional regulator [Williamsia sp.]MBJ7289491.1 TetR/AcrR family transcriptional regulator C-terminal domain-containing protein [Williamsia sp.]